MSLYENFHERDLSYLKNLLSTAQINPNLAKNLIEYWEMRLDDPRDSIYHDYFEYYLFFECLNAGIIMVFIYDKNTKKVLHQYGILLGAITEIIRLTEEELKQEDGNIPEYVPFFFQNQSFQLWRKYIVFQQNELYLCALMPSALRPTNRLKRLQSVFLRYYLPESLKSDLRFLDSYFHINKEICQSIAPVLREARPVTFTYFRFEDFSKYIALGGENFANSIVRTLNQEITSRLKHEDRAYILSPRDYLVVSLNCEKELMEKRFHRMMFQIQTLILSYRVRYSTYNSPIVDLTPIWKDIAIVD